MHSISPSTDIFQGIQPPLDQNTTTQTIANLLANDPASPIGQTSNSSAPSVPSQLQIDGQAYHLSFNDEFNEIDVSFWDGFGQGGIWSTSFSPHLDDTRTVSANGELQYYSDPDMSALPNPFSLGNGSLTISATALTPAEQAVADGMAYNSGLMTTEMSFAMSAGYIEIRADVPDQLGFWSAFWLLPADGDWSAELDIFEILGESADTIHTNVWDNGTPNADYTLNTGAGTGYHTYGLFWDEDVIQWSYDGTVIREAVNTIDEDMYLAINLAVGGWAQDPDSTTDFSDGLSIDYVRVYELSSDPDSNVAIADGAFVSQNLHTGTAGNDVLNGSRWGDVLDGGAGADTVYGDEGNDTLSGDDGADRLFGQVGDDVLNGGAGNDHLVGSGGSDVISGGAGTDHMWGGSYGADGTGDVFEFQTGDATDFIHDFETGFDQVSLTDVTGGWADIQAVMEDRGWATYLNLSSLTGSGGDALYLANVDIADLTAANFTFLDVA